MDCSPPGSSVHGIVQARILEWIAIFSSKLFRLLLFVTVSLIFFDFDDLKGFEEYWSDILNNVLQLGFVQCFFS